MNFTFWGLYGRKFIGIGKGETDLIPQIGNTGPTPLKRQGETPVELPQRSNLTPLLATTCLVPAILNFRVLDLSATSGTSGQHVLNPGLKDKKINVECLQRYNYNVSLTFYSNYTWWVRCLAKPVVSCRVAEDRQTDRLADTADTQILTFLVLIDILDNLSNP